MAPTLCMPSNPTKAQELATWEAFLASLPEGSYLALYLEGSSSVLKAAMAVDMSTDLVSDLLRQRAVAQDELRAVQADVQAALSERDAVKRQVSALSCELARLRGGLEDVARAAQTLAVCAADAHAKANKPR